MISKNYARHCLRVITRFIKNSINNEYFPIMLTVMLTSRCMRLSTCANCWRPKESYNPDDISLDAIKKISEAKIPVILLSGGEPTEHKDFTEIVNCLIDSGSRVHVLTNGDNTDKLIEALCNKDRSRVVLSINQYDTKERVQQINNTIKILNENRLTVYVNLPLDSNNFTFGFFDVDVIRALTMVERIIITPYITDRCIISEKDFSVFDKCSKYLSSKHNLKNIVVTKKIPVWASWLCKFFAWIIDKKFDECSGYPFRATMDEKGVLQNCLRRALSNETNN